MPTSVIAQGDQKSQANAQTNRAQRAHPCLSRDIIVAKFLRKQECGATETSQRIEVTLTINIPNTTPKPSEPSQTMNGAAQKKYHEEKAQLSAENITDSTQSHPRPACSNKAMIAAAQKKYNGEKAPLSAALRAKDESAAEALLDGGGDPNKVDWKGWNALHWAAETGCSLPLFRRVLSKIHNVNAATIDDYPQTALVLATIFKRLDIVVALMNHQEIDLNLQDWDDNTVLHKAVYYNYPAIVTQLLSDDRTNSRFKDYDDRTPLKLATKYKHHECEKILMDQLEKDIMMPVNCFADTGDLDNYCGGCALSESCPDCSGPFGDYWMGKENWTDKFGERLWERLYGSRTDIPPYDEDEEESDDDC